MNGILLIDKPSGWTSNDVVVKLKGALHQRRIGHSGTLDPMATGLLVVFVGRATRAVEFAEADSKRYLASLRLGITTDTQDISGSVLRSCDVNVSDAELQNVLKLFVGDIMQLPPMYSAIKVNGRKLYDIARKGGNVERKERKINISRLEYKGCIDGDICLDVSCSKGTYIRTLCHDIGEKLGCGGCMSALRRVQAGIFDISQAHSLEAVLEAAAKGTAEELLIPVDRLFAGYEAYTAATADCRRIKFGNEIPTALPDGEYRVYSPEGEFLMLGRAENSILKTVKNFFEVEAK